MATVTRIDPTNLTLQSYEAQDSNLISQFDVNSVLTGSSYIEFFVYDNNNNLLYSTYNYNSYTVLNNGQSAANGNEINNFNISPGNDVENQGFDQGEYLSYYNFLTKQIGDPNTNLFIQEISSDRTEIRLDSNILSTLDIVEQTNNFIQFRDDSTYFVDFYLNFGDNDLIIANNIQLEDATTNDPTILVKLYEPLPPQFELRDQLWIVTTLNEPEAFNVNFPPQPIEFIDFTNLAGPNFNIPIKDQVNNSTQNLSYTDLVSGAPTSSLDQLNSLMDSSSLSISVDYTDFTEFIHFSSAQTRLENFYYKVQLITGYSASIASLTNVTSSATSTTILQSKISEITKNFDKYEYFLYYDSGSSYSWPKTTTEPPYLLATTGSTTVLNWFGSVNEQSSNYGGLILSASNYDDANKDQLLKSIPEYLREDAANRQYDLFVDMVAQYYDNVWIYTKDVTQKYNADNRLDFGVSKDLVSDAIKDFGVKLYQNNFSKDDLYTAFLGLTPGGALFPFPEITSSLPTPTGFEYVDTLISASNDIIPLDDVNKSLYKRIYHNIPYLLKSKGTIAGLRALITSYGIPDTILKISEFGGKDKVNENDWDYYFNKFNHAWDTQGNNFISSSWDINPQFNYTADVPGTVELRFKINNFPTSSSPSFNASQSLWHTEENGVVNKALVLEYTGSYSVPSGSYDGAIKDPYYQYGNLKYIANPNTANEVSCSVYLPFYDGGWWSVMVREDGFDTNVKYLATEDLDFILTENGDYIINDSSGLPTGLGTASLFASNKIYNGADGTSIGYFNSSSLIDPTVSGSWLSGSTSYFAKEVTLGNQYEYFNGNIQEIRYYNVALGTTRFEDYVMNPLSIEGNSINSSPDELLFRASLGGELDTSTDLTQVSIHPKITGSWVATSSFVANSNYVFNSTPSYSTNTEYYFLDQFPAGIKNRITDKIRYEDNVVPAGDTLSPYRRVTQATEASESYTENINYLEVAFSPQNEINDDIVSQLGYFNIGDYIGDPRQRSSSLDYYPDLNNLSKAYFEKYIKNYDLVDFVRLIKFFDNSLFKMIKDFIPARTSLASGIVIKQHLLERNKYPQPQVSYSEELLTGSIDIGDVEGGPGGMLNIFNGLSTSPSGTLGAGPDNRFNLTQSWEESYTNLSGSVTRLNDSQHEFYDGEFSGSTMLITNGELNSECDEFKNVSIASVPYYAVRFYNENGVTDSDGFLTNQALWLSDNNLPLDGYISIFREGIFSPVGVRYIKIPKIDGNGVDQSTSLESLTQITLPGTTNVTYQLTSVTEKPTFYLYDVEPNNVSPPLFGKLNYDFTGSIDTTVFKSTFASNLKQFYQPTITSIQDSLNLFNSNVYNLDTYPQKSILIRATGSLQYENGGLVGGVEPTVRLLENGNDISSTILPIIGPFGATNTATFNISSTINPSSIGNNFSFDIQYRNTAGSTSPTENITSSLIASSFFFITSSAASATSSVDSVLEPYFSSDFSRALDCQPLLNNVQGERANPFLQDLDYQTSQTVPVNYQAIVSESATKATVPESNYTQLSSANIRYNGSKNQSEKLNFWTTQNNIGTYGKTPSISNENALITYCEWVENLSPIINGAVGASISYIINEDDSVREPNLTEGAISDVQFAFPTGENCIVSLTDPPVNTGMEILNDTKRVIKGGYRVEPILYSQITDAPFSSSITMVTSSLIPLPDVRFNAAKLSTQVFNASDPLLNKVLFDNLTLPTSGDNGWDISTSIYTVPLLTEESGVDLSFDFLFNDLRNNAGNTSGLSGFVKFDLLKSTDGGANFYLVSGSQQFIQMDNGGGFHSPAGSYLGNSSLNNKPAFFTISIPSQDVVSGDQYYLQLNLEDANPVGTGGYEFEIEQCTILLNQFPSSVLNPDIDINDTIWGYSSSRLDVITGSNDQLNTFYNFLVQEPLIGSGFPSTSLIFTIEPGDQFRFQDDEFKVYNVIRVIPPSEDPEGKIIVYLDKEISPSINKDYFLIRRYVKDGSFLIFDSNKPTGSSGPAVIKPQYVTKPLEKSSESFVLLLAERGLIT
tara:strand:- start:1125 stop:7223 length:6099 start_codon:yes stop_codon:yes gene_type:complete